MTDRPFNSTPGQPGLLPAGLRDVLAPRAEAEARMTERLMGEFAAWGYQRVKPPLIEFENTLLAGPGAALAQQTFRLLDPISQQMMGLRPDITVQIARLASTRLKDAARPLRLSYNGQVLRVRGSQLRPERQFAQAGFELIGVEGAGADAEVARLAVSAVGKLAVQGLSVDIVDPTLVPCLCDELAIAPLVAEEIRLALDAKDAGGVKSAAGRYADLFDGLLAATGEAKAAMRGIANLSLPPRTRAAAQAMVALAQDIGALNDAIGVTLDPCEFRGFEYHSGLSFTLFARGVRGELGRGGRYRIGGTGEAATGCTLYLDSLMRALPSQDAPALVYLPFGLAQAEAQHARGQGLNALQGLAPESDLATEARRLGCTHLWRNGVAEPLG